MIPVTFGLDRVASVVHAYHILCTPSELTKKYNPVIFQNFSVGEAEKEEYIRLCRSKGLKTPSKIDWLRAKLYFPGCSNLDQISHPLGNLGDCLKNLEIQMQGYLSKLESNILLAAKNRQAEAADLSERIFIETENLTGLGIERPKSIQYLVVAGMAPSAHGDKRKGIQFVWDNCNNYFNQDARRYISTIIHEALMHDVASAAEADYVRIFDVIPYSYEEGFVKFFEGVVARKIGLSVLDMPPWNPEEASAFEVCKKRWPPQGEFKEWYLNCMKEILNK